MPVGGAVRMSVAVFGPMRVIVSMPVGMASMIMGLVRMKILDPLLALAAATCAAHQTTSISLRRISSPP